MSYRVRENLEKNGKMQEHYKILQGRQNKRREITREKTMCKEMGDTKKKVGDDGREGRRKAKKKR